jgi:hypothetical protein
VDGIPPIKNIPSLRIIKIGGIFIRIPPLIMMWAIVRVIKEWVDLHFTPPLGCGWKTK